MNGVPYSATHFCLEEALSDLYGKPGRYVIAVPYSFGDVRGCLARWDSRLERYQVQTRIRRIESPTVLVRVQEV